MSRSSILGIHPPNPPWTTFKTASKIGSSHTVADDCHTKNTICYTTNLPLRPLKTPAAKVLLCTPSYLLFQYSKSFKKNGTKSNDRRTRSLDLGQPFLRTTISSKDPEQQNSTQYQKSNLLRFLVASPIRVGSLVVFKTLLRVYRYKALARTLKCSLRP